jgi:membrane associated rhomboid family serine protease
METLDRALAYHASHPYLALDPRLAPLAPHPGEPAPTAPRKFQALEQVELDGLTRAGFDVLYRTPQWRFGVVPVQEPSPGLVTHLFLHAGVVPLLLNLLLVFAAAPFLEELWGPAIVAGFSVAAGILGAGVFAAAHSGLDVSFLGLSAVASAMVGALAVRRWGQKLRFAYWLGPGRTGVLAAPAPVLLGFWALREVLATVFPDVIAPGSPTRSAAYWAHLPAFALGAAAAFAARHFQFEERFLGIPFPTEAEEPEGPAIPQEGFSNGEADWPRAWAEAGKYPEEPRAVLALWDLATQLGRVREAVPLLVRLFRSQVQRGDLRTGLTVWTRLREGHTDVNVPFPVLAQFAERLHAADNPEFLEDVLAAAADRADGADSPSALLRLGRLAAGETRDRIKATLLARPEVPAAVREEVAGWDAPQALARPRRAEPSSTGPLRNVRILTAVPVALKDNALSLEFGQSGEKSVPLGRIRGVAAARVGSEADGYALLDLLLAAGAGNTAGLTLLRLDARRFDPRAFVPSESVAEEALFSLAGSLVTTSSATWLVGSGLGELPRYPSLLDYEASLRGALGLPDD